MDRKNNTFAVRTANNGIKRGILERWRGKDIRFTDKVLALLEDFQNEEFTISDVKKYLEENGIQYITKKPL